MVLVEITPMVMDTIIFIIITAIVTATKTVIKLDFISFKNPLLISQEGVLITV